nr:MAG TPA: hypothetical protein [Caudoviricetes sp.]
MFQISGFTLLKYFNSHSYLLTHYFFTKTERQSQLSGLPFCLKISTIKMIIGISLIAL